MMEWEDEICKECKGEGKVYYEDNQPETGVEGVTYDSTDKFECRFFRHCRSCGGKGYRDWIDVITNKKIWPDIDDKMINIELFIKPVCPVEYVTTTFTIPDDVDPEQFKKDMQEVIDELYD